MKSSTLSPDLGNANVGSIVMFLVYPCGCTFFVAEMTIMKANAKRLTLSAVLMGLAAVLSVVRVYELPMGGSITLLSMLPICVISMCYGWKWGTFCSLIYAGLQLAMGFGQLMGYGMTPAIWIGCLLFDYLFPFGGLGFSGMFRKCGTWGMCSGICISIAFRFLCHFLSGVILFGEFAPAGQNIYLYSLVYNGSYMLPEMILTVVGAVLLLRLPQIKKLIEERQ